MRMALVHPGFRTCSDCQRFMYDVQTGERLEFPPRSGQPMQRPPHSPTPCDSCPKCFGSQEKTAEVGQRAELSERNMKTVDIYFAVHGAKIDTSQWDETTIVNLGLIYELLDEHRRGVAEGMLSAGTFTGRILASMRK